MMTQNKALTKVSIWVSLTFAAVVLCASNAVAYDWVSNDHQWYKYRDGGYHRSWVNSGSQIASHSTTAWQELGTSKSPDSFGVSWSTDGSSWGNDDLYVGQTVQFKFNMHKNNKGTHYADHLKAWIDWDNDGFQQSDAIIYREEVLSDTTIFTYYSGSINLTDSHLGDSLLRARVTCSHSLVDSMGGGWDRQWDSDWLACKGGYESMFKPTGEYYQGEVEDYLLTVKGTPPGAPVPEPATLMLFGFGLIGLARISRKKV